MTLLHESHWALYHIPHSYRFNYIPQCPETLSGQTLQGQRL